MKQSVRLMGFVLQATSWILAFAIGMLTCSFNMPVTKRGVQCPTAAIQQIQVVSYERTLCGCLVKKITDRAPREGEAGFKQCRCAERRAGEKQEQSTSVEAKPAITISCSPVAAVYIGGALLGHYWSSPPYASSTRPTPAFSPATPPPQVA